MSHMIWPPWALAFSTILEMTGSGAAESTVTMLAPASKQRSVTPVPPWKILASTQMYRSGCAARISSMRVRPKVIICG